MESSPKTVESRHESFVREREAALFLGVSSRTLQRWRAEPPQCGGPRFYRLGGRIAYRLGDLVEWAEAQACESSARAAVRPHSAG